MNKQSSISVWNNALSYFSDINVDVSKTIYDELVRVYANPSRHYHNLAHIEYMNNTTREMLSIFKFEDHDKVNVILVLATFFHDAVYEPLKPMSKRICSDEEMSADYAMTSMEKMGIDDIEIISNVCDLIRITEKHKVNEALTIDPLIQKIFIDADMAIFASPDCHYDMYREAVRNEYAHIDTEQFILGRKNFLTKLASHKSIFVTEYMEQVYEEQARCNISRELKYLDHLYVEALTQ